MSRWRPPQPKSSPYITPEGYAALQTELQGLWHRRKDVTRAITAAAAEGDRSENAEYIYRKKELREIDRRIRYLQKRLPDLTVVNAVADQSQIFFGAWVTLEREDGSEVTYRVVGADEIDPSQGFISLDSPMGKGLLKKRIDDEIALDIGGQHTLFVVIDIRYGLPAVD
jgi:transcription elongation factor GreB